MPACWCRVHNDICLLHVVMHGQRFWLKETVFDSVCAQRRIGHGSRFALLVILIVFHRICSRAHPLLGTLFSGPHCRGNAVFLSLFSPSFSPPLPSSGQRQMKLCVAHWFTFMALDWKATRATQRWNNGSTLQLIVAFTSSEYISLTLFTARFSAVRTARTRQVDCYFKYDCYL